MNSITDFIWEVNIDIDHHNDLLYLNSGGCGWYSYYMQKEIRKRWVGVRTEFVYLERVDRWSEDDYGVDYQKNIKHNASLTSLWDDAKRSSCSHVVTKVTTPQGEVFWFDSDAVYDSEEEFLADREDCEIDDEFEMKLSLYRKGALEGAASWNWNDCYAVSRGNKALREILKEV